MEAHWRLAETDSTYRRNRLEIEILTKEYQARSVWLNRREAVITIPVVVHVVYRIADENISDDQIRSQIEVLNKDFRRLNSDAGNVPSAFREVAADTRIEFRLALRDASGKPTVGITRTATTVSEFHSDTDDIKFAATGGHDAWPSDRYLNVWVGGKVIDPNIGELLGYAHLPGGPRARDGVVIMYRSFGDRGGVAAPFHLGRTATHEIGHWLNLLHIWGDDKGACDTSDEVDDTPNQAGPNEKCPKFPRLSCSNGPAGDMFMNYMDYTDDRCMCLFTAGQAARMDATLSGPRASILSADALGPPINAHPAALAAAKPGKPIPRLLGREHGKVAMRVFNGVDWVPLTEASPLIAERPPVARPIRTPMEPGN